MSDYPIGSIGEAILRSDIYFTHDELITYSIGVGRIVLTMADGRVEESSHKIVSIESDCFDFNKINEYILLRGAWCSAGGSSKRFDSSTSEFVVMWYPDKHNSLAFTGSVGERTKDSLVKLCTYNPFLGQF